MAMWGYFRRFVRRLFGKTAPDEQPENLTPQQKLSLIMLGFIFLFLLLWITGN
jgi:hypothetical protein